jgi:hypothetical protein
MQRLALFLIAGLVAVLPAAGCSDTSKATRETKVSTPEGSTTVRTTQEIEKTGDNPPPANP